MALSNCPRRSCFRSGQRVPATAVAHAHGYIAAGVRNACRSPRRVLSLRRPFGLPFNGRGQRVAGVQVQHYRACHLRVDRFGPAGRCPSARWSPSRPCWHRRDRSRRPGSPARWITAVCSATTSVGHQGRAEVGGKEVDVRSVDHIGRHRDLVVGKDLCEVALRLCCETRASKATATKGRGVGFGSCVQGCLSSG